MGGINLLDRIIGKYPMRGRTGPGQSQPRISSPQLARVSRNTPQQSPHSSCIPDSPTPIMNERPSTSTRKQRLVEPIPHIAKRKKEAKHLSTCAKGAPNNRSKCRNKDPDTFARNSSSLACRRFKGSHIFNKIAELILQTHEEYDLRLFKITKTVTDKGSNMVKAFKIFGKPDLETDTSGGPLLNELENFEVKINDENLDNNNQRDDDDNDDILALNEFPISQGNDLYQLPNHEMCNPHLTFDISTEH
ncbi:hypothetical protein EVAR_92926_1 [Eumeta japonica]|uniref:Uncharacterized protein n=1 Tax=Eumeta variegata TaxID=151549 RepID=A0A4C1TCW1_EUMVA|nr:hypothetical protein EVAR_92926_1 [Eumeta japonica]